MSIDPAIAHSIVDSIKGVIRHDINFFDTDGIIIASTDPSRVGSSHEGALLAIRTGRTVNVDAAHRFAGAVDGINMPVMVNGSVVAVVGITGDIETVEPFGTIVRKMTEILIRDNARQVIAFDRWTMMDNLINLLNLPQHDESLVDYPAAALRTDLARPRQVVVMRPAERGPARMPHQDVVRSIVDEELGDSPASLFRVTSQGCEMFLDHDAAQDWTPTLTRIGDAMRQQLGVTVLFGVCETDATAGTYRQRHDEALTAAQWQRFIGQRGVGAFEDLDIALAVTSMPTERARRLSDRVFGTLSDQRIAAFAKVFDAYTLHNGSITHAARELFIHKNTMQNRLNTIATATGYNPRRLTDYRTLALAFTLHDYLAFIEADR
ncbi:CdaR family transcriptional regulator [Bifidobacterium mongoliense]|uniref:CdaR family transcriptional regulator n=1 Tax=Bifidobacterium mongoliense TaxID=518643 RepID=UPI0030EF545A